MTQEATPPDQWKVETSLVEQLIAEQFPQWADHTIEPIKSAGTDNAMFSLGTDMVIRVPRAVWATGKIDLEYTWLPELAPHLPLDIPIPLARGEPSEAYPWPWSVSGWLKGDDLKTTHIHDVHQAAEDLAGFLEALQSIDPEGGPRAGALNNYRGVALKHFDERVRSSIRDLGDLVDAPVITAAWEETLAASPWARDRVWVHGDIHPANMLARDGRLTAIIDFGCMGIGDPAVDMLVAWNFLDEESREIFRDLLSVDDATWQRGRGWCLATSLIAWPYYINKNAALVKNSRRVLSEALGYSL